jgi:alkylated DNA repair dioxygenase AlkB
MTMDLFADTPLQLVDDAEGGIRYWPAFAGADEAAAWFRALCDGCAWHHQRRPMYDRVVDVPRLQAWYPIEAMPGDLPLAAMLERVRETVPGAYNSVGLNLYRDGQDSVAMHNDKLHTLVPAQPLALVSMGAPRRMNIRAKAGGRAIGIELEPGSLLVMSHASQLTHEHGIPKTSRAVPPRMSAVFRARPAPSASPAPAAGFADAKGRTFTPVAPAMPRDGTTILAGRDAHAADRPRPQRP